MFDNLKLIQAFFISLGFALFASNGYGASVDLVADYSSLNKSLRTVKLHFADPSLSVGQLFSPLTLNDTGAWSPYSSGQTASFQSLKSVDVSYLNSSQNLVTVNLQVIANSFTDAGVYSNTPKGIELDSKPYSLTLASDIGADPSQYFYLTTSGMECCMRSKYSAFSFRQGSTSLVNFSVGGEPYHRFSEVPLPAGLYLFISGLVALAKFRVRTAAR